jgi:ParB-like chromosome segregation protein Spo0J
MAKKIVETTAPEQLAVMLGDVGTRIKVDPKKLTHNPLAPRKPVSEKARAQLLALIKRNGFESENAVWITAKGDIVRGTQRTACSIEAGIAEIDALIVTADWDEKASEMANSSNVFVPLSASAKAQTLLGIAATTGGTVIVSDLAARSGLSEAQVILWLGTPEVLRKGLAEGKVTWAAVEQVKHGLASPDVTGEEKQAIVALALSGATSEAVAAKVAEAKNAAKLRKAASKGQIPACVHTATFSRQRADVFRGACEVMLRTAEANGVGLTEVQTAVYAVYLDLYQMTAADCAAREAVHAKKIADAQTTGATVNVK